MTEDFNIDLDSCIASYEQHEQNLADFEDSRFGEIYLDDKQGEFYEVHGQ